MSKFVQPITKWDLHSFLGAISYYRKFIPSFSLYSYKLTPATAKTAVSWLEEMLESFHYLRSVLCHVCFLHVPVQSDDFSSETDASIAGIGCVLNIHRLNAVLPCALLLLEGPAIVWQALQYIYIHTTTPQSN